VNNRFSIIQLPSTSIFPFKMIEIRAQGLQSVISVLNIDTEKLCNICIEALSFRVRGHRQVAQGVKWLCHGRCDYKGR